MAHLGPRPTRDQFRANLDSTVLDLKNLLDPSTDPHHPKQGSHAAGKQGIILPPDLCEMPLHVFKSMISDFQKFFDPKADHFNSHSRNKLSFSSQCELLWLYIQVSLFIHHWSNQDAKLATKTIALNEKLALIKPLDKAAFFAIGVIFNEANQWVLPSQLSTMPLSLLQKILQINGCVFVFFFFLNSSDLDHVIENMMFFGLEQSALDLISNEIFSLNTSGKPSGTERDFNSQLIAALSKNGYFKPLKTSPMDSYRDPVTGLELDFPLTASKSNISIETDSIFHECEESQRFHMEHTLKAYILREKGWIRVSLFPNEIDPKILTKAIVNALSVPHARNFLQEFQKFVDLRNQIQKLIFTFQSKLDKKFPVRQEAQKTAIRDLLKLDMDMNSFSEIRHFESLLKEANDGAVKKIVEASLAVDKLTVEMSQKQLEYLALTQKPSSKLVELQKLNCKQAMSAIQQNKKLAEKAQHENNILLEHILPIARVRTLTEFASQIFGRISQTYAQATAPKELSAEKELFAEHLVNAISPTLELSPVRVPKPRQFTSFRSPHVPPLSRVHQEGGAFSSSSSSFVSASSSAFSSIMPISTGVTSSASSSSSSAASERPVPSKAKRALDSFEGQIEQVSPDKKLRSLVSPDLGRASTSVVSPELPTRALSPAISTSMAKKAGQPITQKFDFEKAVKERLTLEGSIPKVGTPRASA